MAAMAAPAVALRDVVLPLVGLTNTGAMAGRQTTQFLALHGLTSVNDFVLIEPHQAKDMIKASSTRNPAQAMGILNALREALPKDIRVGTVDKFQGQEAPVCIVSMTASSAEEIMRGMEFLLSLNRINVAVSRAKAMALVFGAPRLREAK